MSDTKHVLTISGGKDSTAMWLYAREKGVEAKPVFCDTGHEHPETYEYVNYLEQELETPIQRVKADFSEQIQRKRDYVQTVWREEFLNSGMSEAEAGEIIAETLEVLVPTGNPFLDLCIWKGRFPSTKARFCTQYLKIIPTAEQVYFPLLDSGHKVISWQGVRREESLARSVLSEEEDTFEGYKIYRPLLDWTAEDVFAMHRRHGVKPNPLYLQGMGRVGCMPCINCNKAELFEIATRFQDEIQRVIRWEQIVAKASKRRSATFFPYDDVAGFGIEAWVEWSKTTRGGRQYDLMKIIEMETQPVCSSMYGLCE